MSTSWGASIESFHLRRSPAEREPLWIENVMEWIGADHRDTALWENSQIKWGHRNISDYTVSLANNTYVVSHINTETLPAPKMKHRDIIVDNWKAAGGELASLRKIAVTFITNHEAYECIENADPNSPGWRALITGNPFLEGQKKMLREYRQEFNRARIERVTVAAHEKSDMIDMYLFNLVTHLVRPSGNSQDDDPEPEPEPEQSPPISTHDYFHQQFPQGTWFSDWNNRHY
ncbi:uncharacterized protein F4807DRAFT_462240 [Annulohypoxylon truncatum]|uniref:uncharacterized protein n=1 Tax=Annulohypoxylon truncatum TaxID=327061 RepID=UPI002007F442|nr:uncharacterized protein F4807DRAFT_462240 [Annulohypoxylon truncatum]KAI1207796.1 hypothetical protein F4807DRAFT_462240 [Annulohypoxylon truncatum]